MAGEPILRVAVAGAGAFGRNHLRVYRELEEAGFGIALAAAVEPDPARAAEAAGKYSIPVFGSVDELLRADLGLAAVSVAVPTVQHHMVAAQLLEAGIDVLLEKPLAATLAEADDLIALAAKHNRILQPGHLERFNPAVLAIEPKLRRPMFFEAHRLSVFTPRSLDVDVVLDLMIHDLDIVLTFTRSPVREVRAVGLPILSPKVDIANVRIEFESGCVANFTASRVSTERVRKLRFFEPRQYVSIDYARRDVLVIRVDPSAGSSADLGPKTALPAALIELAKARNFDIEAAIGADKIDLEQIAALGGASPAGLAHPSAGLWFSKPEITPGEPLRLEIESFFDAVRTRRPPRVTAQQGRDALALALEIQSTMAAHAQRAGLADFYTPSA